MFSPKKPYSAVTVTIERLTSETIAENDLSGIPDLVEVVNLQDTGPMEASRAIRKKLKYGSLHRQLRALTLLDGLIQNAGTRFQRTFADEPLLERLRFCGTAELSDPVVRRKCAELFRSWATEYKGVRGMERVVTLYKELPRRKHVVTQEKSRVLKETENPFCDEEDDECSLPGSSEVAEITSPKPVASGSHGRGHVHSFSFTGKDKKKKDKGKDKKSRKLRPFNLEAEKDNMKSHIGDASIAATNLMSTLQSINREKERISENAEAVRRFENCKLLRRHILRYIHHVESEEWLGGLLHANDELVQALMTFEQLDRSIDADSDSDDDVAEQAHLYRMATEKAKGKELASPTSMTSFETSPTSPRPTRPAPPPRPSALSKPSMNPRPQAKMNAVSDDEESADEDDDDDPFADRNALLSPNEEKSEPKW